MCILTKYTRRVHSTKSFEAKAGHTGSRCCEIYKDSKDSDTPWRHHCMKCTMFLLVFLTFPIILKVTSWHFSVGMAWLVFFVYSIQIYKFQNDWLFKKKGHHNEIWTPVFRVTLVFTPLNPLQNSLCYLNTLHFIKTKLCNFCTIKTVLKHFDATLRCNQVT